MDATVDVAPPPTGTVALTNGKVAIDVYDADSLRLLLRVPNPTWVYQDLHWSSDNSALVVDRYGQATALLDSATGETFATIGVKRGSTFNEATIVSPSLRFSLSRGDGFWTIYPLPPPDSAPPRESLSRILRDSGLALRGVELVYAR